MVTHQKIRGWLKRNGFKVGAKFESGKFNVSSEFGDTTISKKVRVQFNTGGYQMFQDKAVIETTKAFELLNKEGFIVEREKSPFGNKLSQISFLVSEK